MKKNNNNYEIRLFSLEEANGLLPRLRVLLNSMRQIRKKIMALQARVDIEEMTEGITPKNEHEVERILQQIVNHIDEFRKAKQEIDAMGCELKDLDKGFLDFYTIRNGQVVYLCWMEGEKTITHWHGLDEEFSERQEL